jgi:hypothetical protein
MAVTTAVRIDTRSGIKTDRHQHDKHSRATVTAECGCAGQAWPACIQAPASKASSRGIMTGSEAAEWRGKRSTALRCQTRPNKTSCGTHGALKPPICTSPPKYPLASSMGQDTCNLDASPTVPCSLLLIFSFLVSSLWEDSHAWWSCLYSSAANAIYIVTVYPVSQVSEVL